VCLEVRSGGGVSGWKIERVCVVQCGCYGG